MGALNPGLRGLAEGKPLPLLGFASLRAGLPPPPDGGASDPPCLPSVLRTCASLCSLRAPARSADGARLRRFPAGLVRDAHSTPIRRRPLRVRRRIGATLGTSTHAASAGASAARIEASHCVAAAAAAQRSTLNAGSVRVGFFCAPARRKSPSAVRPQLRLRRSRGPVADCAATP